MASTIRDAVTQHWAGKALSHSNERWLKRALGAALKRDRSNFPFLCLRQKKHLTLCCGNSNNIGTACACMTRSRRATILTPPPSVAHCLGHSSCNAWRRAWRACVLQVNLFTHNSVPTEVLKGMTDNCKCLVNALRVSKMYIGFCFTQLKNYFCS